MIAIQPIEAPMPDPLSIGDVLARLDRLDGDQWAKAHFVASLIPDGARNDTDIALALLDAGLCTQDFIDVLDESIAIAKARRSA